MSKAIAKTIMTGAFLAASLVFLSGCSTTIPTTSAKTVSAPATASAPSVAPAKHGNNMVIPAAKVAQTAESLMATAKKGQNVDVEVYEFTDMNLAQRLVRLEQEGVHVRVLMDKTYRGANVVYSYLQAHHVPVASLRVGSSKYHDIDHVKFLEVNGQVLMGGVNWGSESGRTTDVDFLVHDQNSFGTTMFNKDWTMARQGVDDSNRNYSSLPSSGDLFTGDSIQMRLLAAIHSAKTSIDVYMFAFTNRTLEDALVSAKERGVNVSVVMDSHYEKSMNTKAYNLFKSHGIAVRWEPYSNVLHAKLAVIDGTEVIGGSANWTYNGMRYNHELDVDVHSSAAASEVLSALK